MTFDIDANGILQVSAQDKGTGKSEKITITADKGRLSKEEIERMVREAEEFESEDNKVKENIDARNAFEGYVYSLKNQISDKSKLGGKLSEDDKEALEKAVKEGIDWLESNQNAEKSEYEDKRKEVEEVANPIISKIYQSTGGAPGGSDDEGESDDYSHDDL